MLNDILNYLEVTPHLGTAGQPTPEQFTELRAAGYDLVINLRPPASEEIAGEEQIVTGLGMDYLNIPVIWTNPTTENLQAYFQALEANQQRKVFVHCAMNYRVSAFTFLYRVLVEGVPAEEAIVAMRKIWEPNEVWPAFIEQQLKQTSV